MVGSDREYRLKRDAEWRKSEFVVSWPNWGDRGRMRGSSVAPTGTFHRSTCHTLSEEKRDEAFRPADVYTITLERFREDVNRTGVAGKYKVCKHCCKDIVVTGRNIEKPAPPKPKTTHLHVMVRHDKNVDPNAVHEKVREVLRAAGFEFSTVLDSEG